MKILLLPGSSWHRWIVCVSAATSLLSPYNDIMHQFLRRGVGRDRVTEFSLSVECVGDWWHNHFCGIALGENGFRLAGYFLFIWRHRN